MNTITVLAQQINTQYGTDDVMSAMIGDGAGHVWLDARKTVCVVRINGLLSQPVRALNVSGCVSHDQWVSIRRVRSSAVPYIVLGPCMQSQAAIPEPGEYPLPLHARRHEQPTEPGVDAVDIYPTAIMPLRA